jgi:hypothetical protein
MSDAYVVMRADAEDPGTRDVMRKCLLAIQEAFLEVEVIDEQFREDTWDVTGFMLKASGPTAYETLLPLISKLQDGHSGRITVQLIKEAVDAVVDPSELQVEYFRRELAMDSEFVVHVDSCVRLTHSATGAVVRSTCHRSQAANYKEALALMQSLLAARGGI